MMLHRLRVKHVARTGAACVHPALRVAYVAASALGFFIRWSP